MSYVDETASLLAQVLYQYFVGVSCRKPVWKLDIPFGQLIQLVPRLFGFEERRISVVGYGGPATEEPAATASCPSAIHMSSHWEEDGGVVDRSGPRRARDVDAVAKVDSVDM